MSTRVSVKVALAWSTCAQMGFMLVQCGLGLWHLALLHLVAHSLYKAHAFLSAGSAVDDWRLRALTKRPPSPTPGRLGAAALVAIGCAALSVAAARHPLVASSLPGEHASPILAVLFGVSLVPLVASQDRARAAAFSTAARVSGVLLLYVAGHAAAAKMVAVPSPSNAPGWALVGFGFAGLFAVKATLHLRPDGRLACALHPWLFAGLYLDERFTRLTFRTWPPRLPRQAETVGSPDVVEALEVRA